VFILTGLLLAFIIALMVIIKINYWHKMHPTVRKGFESIRSKLMYSSLLRSALQSFYSLAISSLFAIRAGTTLGTQNLVVGIVTTLALIVFSVFS